MMEWLNMKNQRDENGELTNLALALNALEDLGCDCGAHEISCAACISEVALKDLWNQLAAARKKIANQASRIRTLEGPINHAGGIRAIVAKEG